MSKEFFCPENLLKEEEELSPSGKYRLVIGTYKTKEGCWEYTQGRLFRVEGNEFIISIERNYRHFHHNFGSYGEKEYLITGRSYMGLTIVDCASGQEWNYQPTKESWCQVSWQLSPDGKTLLVCGCYWGGSYEYRCYDFDLTKFDSEEGLPLLSYDESLVNPPHDEIYLDERGTLVFQQGKEIPSDLRGDFIPEDDHWYLVFTDPIKYNSHFKEEQDYVYSNPDLWFEVIPEDLHHEIRSFLNKWIDFEAQHKDWNGYSSDREIIRNKCKPYLKKDCMRTNQQVAILERVDDRIVYRRYYQHEE